MNKILLLIAVAGLLLSGCAAPEQEAVNQNDSSVPLNRTEELQDGTGNYTSETENEPGESMPAPQEEGQDADVLVLGRSVAYGWLDGYMGLPWECFDEECHNGTLAGEYRGYHFTYHELDIPPAIADSAGDGMDRYGAETVFFKLCFADFEPDESGANAERNKGYVQEVYEDAVAGRNRKLIVGNALPKVSEQTDSALVSNHKVYNAWLDDFAATREGIGVLDLYGILADGNGSLKAEYALGPHDSHLSNEAYAAITPEFLELLE
ncbi:hypothetical protein GF318_03485 [Candidatus Micrarchaeota archaeon]|nr:hypothetical protein [Candidatus Micrarchaeota archaeon]